MLLDNPLWGPVVVCVLMAVAWVSGPNRASPIYATLPPDPMAATSTPVPQSMLCSHVSEPGGPHALGTTTAAVPAVVPGTALIQVHYAGVNRADTLQRKGKYPPPPGQSDVIGLEVSGVVVAMEPGESPVPAGVAVGARVATLLGSGGYAEYALAPVEHLIPLPAAVPLAEGGAFPEAFMTAFQAVSFIGGLGPGETMLIHGGASGVGTAAIQIARILGASKIIVTASTADKLAMCESLGATHTINYKTSDFVEEIAAITEGKGVNLVVDYVGSAYFARNMAALAVEGRMVMLGFLSGSQVDGPLSLAPILRKRLTITGSTLRARSRAYKTELVQAMVAKIGTAWADNSLRVVVDSVFDFASQSGDAHAHMEANANIGKIVLAMPGAEPYKADS